ncbi:MAG TPA: DUF3276 family protein [Chitinophagales bacterium]|nr:DUF3276 family protein [Chitinophagales bacterium]
MEKDNSNGGKYSGFFSKKLRAGKRRTYFFDVRSTKQGDFFLTITESKKKFEGDGYDSHKIFLYKEDFKKFLEALNETVDYIKTELMPEYDYDSERPARTPGDSFASEPAVQASANGQETKAASDNTFDSGPANPSISDDEQVDWN